jgi:nicotinate-nucleotide adenylyltransferase
VLLSFAIANGSGVDMSNHHHGQRIGLFGGAFDPIHFGHLLLAREFQWRCDLSQVEFIPAGSPPHKAGENLSPAKDRLVMVAEAIRDFPHFSVSSLETDRQGISYSIDTMRLYRQKVGKTVPLFFAMGLDAFLEIATWKEYQRIPEFVHLVVTTRGPMTFLDSQPLPVLSQADCPQRYALAMKIDRPVRSCGSLIFLEIPAIGISSSDIRRRIREGSPIDHLCPAAVCNHIMRNKLYQER